MSVVLKIVLIILVAETIIMLGIVNFTGFFSVPILVLVDVFALTLSSSPVIYFWVIKPYIVQRDDAEKAHLEAKHQAEEADRAKSEFLARVSHEIRTPLNAILGFSELIRDQILGPVGTAQYAEYARDIHASGTHLLSLVNDILDLSKIEAGKFELHEEVFEVREIVNQAVDLVALMSSKKGLGLIIDLAPGLPLLYADRRAVQQMLINLLSNSIKFAPEGSSVTVRASAATHGLTVAVADTGIGIDPKDMEKVLSPFGQVVDPDRRDHRGTGLGLSLVKSLIELHGGCLVIDSAPGKGTITALDFPPERVRARAEGTV